MTGIVSQMTPPVARGAIKNAIASLTNRMNGKLTLLVSVPNRADNRGGGSIASEANAYFLQRLWTWTFVPLSTLYLRTGSRSGQWASSEPHRR
jgi:hypothetical protein